MEIHGTYEAVVEAAYRKYHGLISGQATLFSLIPDDVRKKIGGSPC
jgi:urocanate hydratase